MSSSSMEAGDAASLIDLTGQPTTYKVSSVLNRNVKEFGPSKLFDGSPDTCWNSEQGSPQWIRFQFNRLVYISKVQLMFQGGFAGKEVDVSVIKPSTGPIPSQAEGESASSSKSAEGEGASGSKSGVKKVIATVCPEDDNSLQISMLD